MESNGTVMTEGRLLDEQGRLIQPSWSTQLKRIYSRNDIKASGWRIKEWDYYIVTNGRYAVALTVADNSYMSLASASWLDFTKPAYKTTSKMNFFTFGKLNLPSTFVEGNIIYNSNTVKMNFIKEDDKRYLTCVYPNFDSGKSLEVNLTLSDFPKDNMVIASPFDGDEHSFYYNAKVNCQTASGYVKYGDQTFVFDSSDSLGTLDWGRGVWTYKNTWYWSSLSTIIDGHKFGFNLGYGFSNREKSGSENMLFMDGTAHKLSQVTFNIPKTSDGKDDFMSPWTFTSDDKRIEMTFSPVIDRIDNSDIGIIASKQHQVFGKFNGTAILDDGSKVQIVDKLGFAEKVYNKW